MQTFPTIIEEPKSFKQANLFNLLNTSGKDSFCMHNRRYLGNKFRLLKFIQAIVEEHCSDFKSFCDIFAGTGVVGEFFNKRNIKIISNDILKSNFVSLKTFLSIRELDLKNFQDKIDHLNSIKSKNENYFSEYFGNTFFTFDNAKKIGAIREEIDNICDNDDEKNALITSLIYATDKVANTVGHYDAFRKKIDSVNPIKLLIPKIAFENNIQNEIFQEDANTLIKRIKSDVLYLDPPYNSRQYCDAYHLLENLATWNKPDVFGKACKMDRTHLKSDYCLKNAKNAFAELITNADCKHILISYNNTGDSKDGRSNARILDTEITQILEEKGQVTIFEQQYKAFTAGKSIGEGHSERIFYCKVKN